MRSAAILPQMGGVGKVLSFPTLTQFAFAHDQIGINATPPNTILKFPIPLGEQRGHDATYRQYATSRPVADPLSDFEFVKRHYRQSHAGPTNAKPGAGPGLKTWTNGQGFKQLLLTPHPSARNGPDRSH
jgi:hypothetical protein